ncbi:MAG TPA: NAD-dependent epimerase/dehydratase family protein [Haliangiales bacterium]|nr:NAD-dependent epimerase/dehydratase family protein [Haliangiales bacterium]
MILVTGATGLTGQFVVAELLRRGRAVRVLCRSETSARACAAGAEVALGDLRDPDSLARAARGASGIVHAACAYGDSSIDIAAMRALLGSWRTGPFVFVSSLDVYGFAQADPIVEETPLCETYNDYARGKIVCERLLAEAAAEAGRRDHVALRAPYIWGPHPTARKRLVPRRLDDHRPIVLPGADAAEWRQYRDVWIDVRDLATIVAECVERPAGRPLNALTGHFTWHDLYVELIRLTGSRSEIVHRPLDAIGDDELPRKEKYAQTWRFSEARLARHLGPIPRRTFHATVRDTVDCCR